VTAEPLRILIADDHPVYRDGLRSLVASMPDAVLVGEASDGAEVVRAALDLQPDVVVMDLRMPHLNGIEATAQIVSGSPRIAVLVLSMFEDDDSVFAAMRAGARGYMLKGADRADIVRAIESVAHGEAIFAPTIASRVIEYFSDSSKATEIVLFPELTSREREILELLAEGRNNANIAGKLTISPKTVRNHVSNIFMKLQVADRSQAIVRAREAGLGRRDDPR
jgi:DNA-binding NarL/FixJ family response regulator